ncbi:MAG: RNA polymerase sigma factor [Planctomycetota bacterium]|jgi:RNA polymerase sigma-70 factor (ECF subfamily)
MDRPAEHALVRKAKAGDERAVEALIRAHQDALYAFILRMSGRPEVAEDIVQEAFVRVLKNMHRFDNRFRFSTWLFTIAKRLYMNSIQKLGPSFDSQTVNDQWARSPGPGRQSARSETIRNARDLIDTALKSLAPQQREIILLFHQQNWAIAEIAEHLRIPQGTVKSHLHRGRKRMRRVLSANRTMQRHAEEVWS